MRISILVIMCLALVFTSCSTSGVEEGIRSDTIYNSELDLDFEIKQSEAFSNDVLLDIDLSFQTKRDESFQIKRENFNIRTIQEPGFIIKDEEIKNFKDKIFGDLEEILVNRNTRFEASGLILEINPDYINLKEKYENVQVDFIVEVDYPQKLSISEQILIERDEEGEYSISNLENLENPLQVEDIKIIEIDNKKKMIIDFEMDMKDTNYKRIEVAKEKMNLGGEDLNDCEVFITKEDNIVKEMSKNINTISFNKDVKKISYDCNIEIELEKSKSVNLNLNMIFSYDYQINIEEKLSLSLDKNSFGYLD